MHQRTEMAAPHRDAKPNLQESDVTRNQSAFLRAQCKQLISETSKQCKDMQNEHNQKLGKRTGSIMVLQVYACVCLFVCLSRTKGQRGPVYEDRVGAEVGGDHCGNR